ncbi:hypothetical protein Tco_0581630 [Tanacetum coccineum]
MILGGDICDGYMFFNAWMILGGDICDGRIVHRFHELRVMDQLLPADASPIALSSGNISDSGPEEDDEEDQKRILLTILPTEETMMIMNHLMMTTLK